VHLLFPSDKRGRLERQVVGEAVQRLERWEVGWKTSYDQLKELAGVLEVLEAMGSQILQVDPFW
jgi:hypothetical protein